MRREERNKCIMLVSKTPRGQPESYRGLAVVLNDPGGTDNKPFGPTEP